MTKTCDKAYVAGVIPAYKPDEKLEETAAGALRECPELRRLFVVDDGSGPEYAGVFERVAAIDPKIEVLHLGVNSGTGGAIKTGLQRAMYECPDAAGFVLFDADGQHHPEDVAKVVRRFLESPDAFTIGVREYHDGAIKIPLRSRLGNRVTETVFRLCTGVHLKDTQSGLRCLPPPVAALCTQIEKNRYEFHLEALILAIENAPCVQVPIRTIYEEGNRRSHFRPVVDSLRIYAVFLRFVASSLVSFAVDYVVFSVAFLTIGSILPSLIISRIISCSVNFIINKISVFRSKRRPLKEAAGFVLLAVTLFTLSYFGMRFMRNWFGMSPLISKILVETVLFTGSFAVQRLYVFSRR